MAVQGRQTRLLSVALSLRTAIQSRSLRLLLGQLNVGVIIALIHVDVAALVADSRPVWCKEKLPSVIMVERCTAWGHLMVNQLIVLKESPDGDVSIFDLVLDVGEAVVTTQLRGKARAVPLVGWCPDECPSSSRVDENALRPIALPED